MYSPDNVDPTPRREPADIRGGDTPKWTLHLRDYPASAGWTAKYFIQGNRVKQAVSATVNADGDAFDFVLPVLVTTALLPGEYAWQTKVYKGAGSAAEVYTVHYGTVKVSPDLSAVDAGYDPRSDARQMVDLITDTMKQLANSTIQSKTIAGVLYTQKDMSKLHTLRQLYREEVFNEGNRARIKDHLGSKLTIKTEFRRPS